MAGSQAQSRNNSWLRYVCFTYIALNSLILASQTNKDVKTKHDV